MIRAILTLLAAIGSLAVAAPGFAEPKQAAKLIQTLVEIAEGPEIVGRPTIKAPSGETVTVVRQEPDGYALRITAEDGEDRSRVAITSELYLARDGKWVAVAAPQVSGKKNSRIDIILPARPRGLDRENGDLRISFIASDLNIAASGRDGRAAPVAAGSGCAGWSEARWNAFVSAPVPLFDLAERAPLGGTTC